MPILEQIVSNYDEFEKQPYTTRFRAANDFFDSELAIDENFKMLPPVERARVRQNYIDEEVGSSLTGADSRISGFYRKMMQGFSNAADIPASALEFVNALTAQGNMNETWLHDAAEWWTNSVSDKPYWEKKVQPTGKYARPIDWKNPSEFFDPKRISGGVLEYGPYTALTVLAYGGGGSLLRKALGTAVLLSVEGGQVAESIAQAEKETGEDIPWVHQAGVTALVGTCNAILESILPTRLARSIKYGTVSRMKAIIANGLLNATSEGITEATQELTQLLAEVGYADEMPDWYGRIITAFHGGMSVGGVFGMGKGAVAPIKPGIEEKVTGVPLGKVEGTKVPVTSVSLEVENSVNEYVQAKLDYAVQPTREGRDTKDTLESKMLQLWRVEHPTDVYGEELKKRIVGAGVEDVAPMLRRIKGTVVPLGTSMEPVKLPSSMKGVSSLALKVPRTDGTSYHIPVKVNIGASHKALNRALTAFSFLRNEFEDVHDKVSEIVVTGGADNAWIRQAIDAGIAQTSDGIVVAWEDLEALSGGVDVLSIAKGKHPESALAQVLNLGDLSKKAGAMVSLPDGTYKILLRAAEKQGKRELTSSDFAYFIGHELYHIRGPKKVGMPAEQAAKIEVEAEAAGERARDLFDEAAAVHTGLAFSTRNPNAASPAHSAVVKHRALSMLGHNFADIRIADGALWAETEPGISESVNGFVDIDTRTAWLSGDAAPWVLGHEAMHVAIRGLGHGNALVKQGLDMFNGSEEELSDVVGKYFEDNMTDKTVMQKLGEWLRNLWTEFVRVTGVQLSQDQLMMAFNKRITDEQMFAIPERTAELQNRRGEYSRLAMAWKDEYSRLKREGSTTEFSGSPAAQALDNTTYYDEVVKEIDERLKMDSMPRYKMSKPTTTLRFYDNLAKVKGSVNLQQLPLKNLKTEEVTFVKSVAQDLMDAGEKVVTSNRLKQAIEVAKIPETAEKPILMFSKRKPFWRYNQIENLMPPTATEKEAAPKRKFAPAIRWGFTGYAETKAAQNIINAMPEDIRKVEEEYLKAHRGDPNDPLSYTKPDSFTFKQGNMWKIALNDTWVSKLLDRMKVGNIGLTEEGDGKLANFTTEERVGGLYRGLLRREAQLQRMLFTKNPEGAMRDIIEKQMELYHQAMNMNHISAGQAVKSFDLHHSGDHLFAMYEGLHMAWAAGYPKEFMEQYTDFISKKDFDGATDYKADYDAKHQSMITKGTNILYGILFEGLLSGAANVKNLASNALWLGTNVLLLRPTRAITSSILSSRAMKSLIPSLSMSEQEAYMPEVAAMIKELTSKRALQRATASVEQAWRLGRAPRRAELPSKLQMPWDVGVDLKTKWEIEMGSIIAPWKAAGLGNAGARVLTMFSRSLIVVDAFFKSLAFDAEIQARIAREMQRTGKAYHEIEVTPEIKAAASEFMNYVTFMDKPGDIAQSAYSMRGFVRRLGLPGRAVIPFVNTLANILQRGIEFTPILGAISGAKDIHTEMSKRNAAARKAGTNTQVRLADTQAFADMVVAQTAGLLLTAVLYGLLQDDDGEDRITGAPPADPRDRVSFYATKQPYSIRIGNQWISYRNVEPLNVVLSNIIAVRDAVREARNPEDMKRADEIVSMSAGSVIENVIQSSYMEGFMNLIRDGRINPAALGRIPAEFVPYSSLMRAIHRTYEVVATGEYAIQDNRKFSASLADTLWWLPEEITYLKRTPRINALGEEIKIHVGKGGLIDGMKLWFPFGVMEAYTDPVEEELAGLRMYVGLPPKKMTIRGQEIDLPDDFHREYSLLYGKYTKEALMKGMERPGYHAMSNEKKVSYLQHAIEPARRRARLIARRQYARAYLH